MGLQRRAALGLLMAAGLVGAAGPDPAAILAKLFAGPAQAAWFAPGFLEKVPLAQVQAVLDSVTAQYGAWRGCDGSATQYTVHLARGDISARIVLNADGLITGLLLRPKQTGGLAAPKGGLAENVRAIEALPGQVSLLVSSGGRDLARLAPDQPLAVGSGFKLAVLAAVLRGCMMKQLRWEDNISLAADCVTLGSGVLGAKDAGRARCVEELAGLMISVSDNMAADALVHAVGRDAVEAVSPRNTPFLTTREAFILKARAQAGLRRDWAAADTAGRRAVLARVDALPLPAAEAVETSPTPEVEWLFSATELRALLAGVGHLPAFEANPGVAQREDWARIAFKGGSEAGVLNLSTQVTGRDGTRHVVVATWNADTALDEQRLIRPYAGILHALATGLG